LFWFPRGFLELYYWKWLFNQLKVKEVIQFIVTVSLNQFEKSSEVSAARHMPWPKTCHDRISLHLSHRIWWSNYCRRMTKATCLTTVDLMTRTDKLREINILSTAHWTRPQQNSFPHVANVPSVWIWCLSFTCILCCCELICRSWRWIVSPLDRDFSVSAHIFGEKS
jgi:hypothetical protein